MPAATSTQRPPPRARLSRERVLRTALDYVDTHGLAALSMQKLGAELSVRGMSLYNYVESKDALLDGIVEIMSQEMELPPADMPWREALRFHANSIRALIRHHPAAAPLLVSRSVMPTRRLEVLSAFQQLLLKAGFGEDRAIEALRTVVVYAQGYALTEVCYSSSSREPGWPADELSRIRRVSEMVPRDAPDHLLRIAMMFCGHCDLDEQFQTGLDLLIRGLESQSAR
ncbi:MAG TPA: TetR/AcrR family transcriptional regulator C-terminal domain-containing protein [Streptosporangiaceae bacterium]|nr:TetR/AcrR family transcriptional regulator C-terminal domain-containing protein [Streptosporangiaceae bacterium]